MYFELLAIHKTEIWLILPDKPKVARPTIQRILGDMNEVKVRRATTTRAAKLQIKAKQMAARTPLNQSEIRQIYLLLLLILIVGLKSKEFQ